MEPYPSPCPGTSRKCCTDFGFSFYFLVTAHPDHQASTSPHLSARNPRQSSSTDPKNSPLLWSSNYKLLLEHYSITPALSILLSSRSPTNSPHSRSTLHDKSSTMRSIVPSAIARHTATSRSFTTHATWCSTCSPMLHTCAGPTHDH
jgi:hypothetical protein